MDTPAYFPEPTASDPTYANRAEPIEYWLKRSTIRRAVDCRRFLNDHVSKMPEGHQDKLVHDLGCRWRSAFFELFVVRLLQEIGGCVALEQSNPDGRRPDFTVEFPDGVVTVEANSQLVDAEQVRLEHDRAPLLEYIETRIPEGWGVGVFELPAVGPNDSKKEFKRTVDRALSTLTDETPVEPFEINLSVAQGDIRLLLWPTKQKPVRLGFEGTYSGFNSTEERILYALSQKRSQVRNSSSPVIIAIEASGISSELEDFEFALYGRTFGRYGIHGRLVETGFQADGAFCKNLDSDKAPTYAGVLAFLSVGFSGIGFTGDVAPVFFKHPRFRGQLPDALNQLEQREYDSNLNQVIVRPGTHPDILSIYNFVSR